MLNLSNVGIDRARHSYKKYAIAHTVLICMACASDSGNKLFVRIGQEYVFRLYIWRYFPHIFCPYRYHYGPDTGRKLGQV